FMKVLNVLVFGIAGGLGLMFLLQTLHRLSVAESGELPMPRCVPPQPVTPTVVSAEELVAVEVVPTDPRSPIDAVPGYILGGHVKTVFRCWAIVFGLVGAQMSWVLRPFIGDPHQPFTWFRPRESNFFENMLVTIGKLFT